MLHVGVCRFTLLVPSSHSLKDKRAVVRRLAARVRQRFGLGLVEIAGQDTWQRAELAFSLVAGEHDAALGAVRAVLAFTAGQGLGELALARHEVVGYGDDWYRDAVPHTPAAADVHDTSWVPAAWLDGPEADEGGR